MRIAILILAASSAALGADAPKDAALSRETALELQLIDRQEEEAQQAITKVVELLRAPIEQAKAAAVARECRRVGIAETDTETCQLDRSAGVVRRVPKAKKGEAK